MQAQDSTIGIDMRTDLDHLPAAKQREIERVKAIIFEEFEDALALAQPEPRTCHRQDTADAGQLHRPHARRSE